MIVVAAGVVVRWEPTGYVVVGWHRHDRLLKTGCPDDVYECLTRDEMFDVVMSHLDTFVPGEGTMVCNGWKQLGLW